MPDRVDRPYSLTLSRRRMLQLLTAAAGTLALQPRLLARIAAVAQGPELARYGFLTSDELAILDAAAAAILPADDQGPGAREIGVVDYVQSLLSYLPGSDANCDRYVNTADVIAVEAIALGHAPGCPQAGDVNGDEVVSAADVPAAESALFHARPAFAGGPFSGRNPQPHFPVGTRPCSECHGVSHNASRAEATVAAAATTDVYPPDAFRQFLPMNRLQRLSWQVRILGPQSVPEVASNAPLVDFIEELPEVDLRQRYRAQLAAIEALSQGAPYNARFVDLTLEQRQAVLQKADAAFVDLLYRHVIQGTLCDPTYGGNRGRRGWELIGFDGDSQPLGYEIYDESVPGFYRERPDKPNSGPDPNEDCSGFSDKMKSFLDLISRVTGGGPLANPYCFEVDK